MEKYDLKQETMADPKLSENAPARNCWEFFGCKDIGTCPVPNEKKLHGTHSGKNAGRSCWIIAGTMCGGSKQGSHIDKEHGCLRCNFYESVKKEEFSKPHGFKLSASLLEILKKSPSGSIPRG
ncbi:MAG: hypothetical protein HZA15_00475 [Nitrospirae bacterium]|nr:hypothetical protein [Nitrospirota bacterium]